MKERKRFWLIYRKKDAAKNRAYINLYLKYAVDYDMECRLVFVEDIFFGIRNSVLYLEYLGNPVTESEHPYFVIIRSIYPSLNMQFEMLGIRCFNSALVSEICNNKAFTYRFLSGQGIPMPDTNFIANQDLSEYLYADHNRFDIIKAVDGHGGSQVVLYRKDTTKCEDDSFLNQPQTVMNIMDNSDVVLQPKVGTRNCDLRVYVIGNKIIASVLRTAKEGFRANFSLGGEVRLYQLKPEEEALVYRIIARFQFDMVGIDFIIDDNDQLIFNEIEDVVGARMLYKCSDIDIVREYLSYIKKEYQADRKDDADEDRY